MAIRFAMNTLTLFCYTGKECCAPPTSAIGGASMCVDLIRKLLFYASFWHLTLTARDRKLAVVGSEVEGLICLQTKYKSQGFYWLRMLAS